MESKKNSNNGNEKIQNSKMILKEGDSIEEENNKSNIYFIFTIDKNNFDKREIRFDLLINGERQLDLLKYDEIKVKDIPQKIINQLYCISFVQPKINESNFTTNLQIKLSKNLNWIKSFQINIPKKNYFFLYEHSF